MVFKSKMMRVAGIALGAVITLLVGAGVASALLVSHTGSSMTRYQAINQDVAWAAVPANNTFVDVPGASLSVNVPAGTVRTLDASFNAESFCGGTTGWCSVRVVVVLPTGTVNELRPVAGTDFAFDSAGGDQYQAATINRQSLRLGAGTYTVKVQAARTAGATSIRLDDWDFEVASIAP